MAQCEGRSYDSATDRVLMEDVAKQETGEPLFMMDATIFHKVLVDRVTALDQKEYEVFLIAASVHGWFRPSTYYQLSSLTKPPSTLFCR